MSAPQKVEMASSAPSPRAAAIVASIDDAALRTDVEASLALATEALAALNRVHLPQDHIEEGATESSADSKHVDLAPYVLAALSSVNRLLEQLGATYPAPADAAEQSSDDFDFAFDLVDGPTGDSGRLASTPAPAAHKTKRELVNDTAYALGAMLRSRVTSFAPRLRHALGQDDPWVLLSELDYYKHALIKAVQGLLFGVLAVFNDAVGREEILPEYRSGVREAVELRAAVADLTFHVGRFNSAISNAKAEQVVPLLVGVSDRLTRFCGRPAYRTLRAEDKKAVIDVRRALSAMRYSSKNGVPVARLRQEIEGFSKFLDAMQAINHREVLVVHDRQRLTACLERIDESMNLAMLDVDATHGRLEAVVQQLGSVMGRHPDLDDALRRFGVTPVVPEQLQGELLRWRGLIEAAASVVG